MTSLRAMNSRQDFMTFGSDPVAAGLFVGTKGLAVGLGKGGVHWGFPVGSGSLVGGCWHCPSMNCCTRVWGLSTGRSIGFCS